MAEAAMAEPLAVCLHAARQAGPLMGRRVLVTGAARSGRWPSPSPGLAGRPRSSPPTSLTAPLQIAERLGATHVLDVAASPDALAPYAADKGAFDILFEASGNGAALRDALDAVRPGGDRRPTRPRRRHDAAHEPDRREGTPAPRTFRFDAEFALAVELMGQGLVDVTPLLTATMPFEQGGRGLRAGLRPIAGDEGATRVLTATGGPRSSDAQPLAGLRRKEHRIGERHADRSGTTAWRLLVARGGRRNPSALLPFVLVVSRRRMLQHRRARLFGASALALDRGALFPLRDRLRVDAVVLSQPPQALSTMLSRATDRLCRAGRSMENLAHSASLPLW